MTVGRTLNSCTTDLELGYLDAIEKYPSLKNYRIALVDTPGFNESDTEDWQILDKILTWLRLSYVRSLFVTVDANGSQ